MKEDVVLSMRVAPALYQESEQYWAVKKQGYVALSFNSIDEKTKAFGKGSTSTFVLGPQDFHHLLHLDTNLPFDAIQDSEALLIPSPFPDKTTNRLLFLKV